MATQPTRSPCVFCRSLENKMSREHVFPEWLANHLETGEREQIHEMEKFPTPTRSETDSRTHPVGWWERKIWGVCKPCNEGWMERELEDGVPPVLIPLLEGRDSTLTWGDQRILATWTWK